MNAISRVRYANGAVATPVSVERTSAAGEMTPLHVHAHDETYHVVEGELTVFLDGAPVVLGAGDEVVAPAGLPHAHRAESQTVRYRTTSTVVSASRYEDFSRAVARPQPIGWTSDDELYALRALAAPNSITVLDAPGATA